MTLDPRFLVALDLNPYLCDKTTGAPLAGGTLEFWKDDNRNVPKLVYKLSGAPPNYTYTALPNPVVLSATGTIEDNDGANCALYYFPWDSDEADANIELYYIVCKNSEGVIQFTREAWPNTTAGSNPVTNQNNTIINQLSNPQFVDVLFNPDETLSISFTGASTTTVAIAPDWDLSITHTGSGTVEVTRNAIAGSSQYPTNPPYSLSFNAGTGITALKLIQRLSHNPDIWSPASGGDNGYVATNVVLAPLSAVTIQYDPSVGAAQTLLSANNTSGSYAQYSNTTQLTAASNSDDGNVGYVDIIINLATSGVTTLTSLQVVGLESNDEGIQFNQLPVNRQEDQLFHYYNPLLQAKQVESYLVGWDFPVNPAQLLGSTVAAFATGNNTSNYVWDQTIAFQTVNSGVSFTRSNVGALRVTGAATGQFALIQYIDMPTVREMLNSRLSVNVSGATSVIAGVEATISLWYTTGASLPNMGANTSLVSALSASGKPTAGNGTWVEVGRSNLGDAVFTMETSATTNFNDYGFSGWDLNGDTGIQSATFAAIVVGFAPIDNADTIDINSISLVPGDIPCRPAPKTADEVLFQCERFYEKSYESSVLAGTVTDAGAVIMVQTSSTKDVNNNINMLRQPFYIAFKNKKRSASATMAIYSNNSGAASTVFARMFFDNSLAASDNVATTGWAAQGQSVKGIGYIPTGGLAMPVQNIGAGGALVTPASAWIEFHYVCDSRLGIV